MKEAFSFSNDETKNQWPSGNTEFKTALNTYRGSLSDLAKRLHNLFAMALGEDERYFSDTYGPCNYGLRMLHYPKQPEARDQDEIGIGAHTDYNWFTFIYQAGSRGLEVQNLNGEWIPVIPRDNTLVVNIGDSMQWVSGGRLRSTRHRVINTTSGDRYSMAFFWSPNQEDILRVAPSSQENSEVHGELVVREYTKRRQEGSRLSHPLLREKK